MRDEKGRRLVFRYYDPCVLRVYLPTCNPAELRTVYGPIECFWTEAESPNNILEFRTRRGELEQWNCQLKPRQSQLIRGSRR